MTAAAVLAVARTAAAFSALTVHFAVKILYRMFTALGTLHTIAWVVHTDKLFKKFPACRALKFDQRHFILSPINSASFSYIVGSLKQPNCNNDRDRKCDTDYNPKRIAKILKWYIHVHSPKAGDNGGNGDDNRYERQQLHN